MSDFLQFVDRVPTLPNRKKITHEGGSVEYATIEYADEPIETGTPLNKANLSKLEWIVGYSLANGVWNPITSTLDYHLDDLNTNSLSNDEIILVKGGSGAAPATDWDVKKASTDLGNGYQTFQILCLNNGNIFMCGYGGGNFGITVTDANGTFIKNTSGGSMFMYPKMVELDNGNIFIVGYTTNSSYSSDGYWSIYDSNGNPVTSGGIRTYFQNPNIIKMSNGNVMVSSTNYAYVYNENGVEVTHATHSLGSENKLLELDNGNILLASKSTGSYIILDKLCNIVKAKSTFGTSAQFSNADFVILNNKNILCVGSKGSSSYNGYIAIIDKDGNIVKSATEYTSSNGYRPSPIKLPNGNVFVLTNNNSTNGYFTIFDESGNIIKSQTSIGSNYYSFINGILMSNGNIVSISCDSNYQGYITMFDTSGTKLKSASFGYYYNSPALVETNDGNIAFIGYRSSGGYYYGSFGIITPKATSGNCKLNGIELDTLLIKNKYYELIYNQLLNKFIAEEVRNAN